MQFDKEARARIDAVVQRVKDFDTEFAIKLCAHALIKLNNRERVGAIYEILDKIDDVLIDAASRAGADAVVGSYGMKVDQAIDLMRRILEAHTVMTSVMQLIDRAATLGNDDDAALLRLDNDQRVGALTPNYSVLNKALENIRIEIVRKRGEYMRKEGDTR